MNETLKPYLERLLSSGAKTVEEAAKFIETQTPELAGEIIRWGAISEVAAPVVGLILAVWGAYLHFKYRKSPLYNDWTKSHPPIILASLVGFIVGTVTFLTNIVDVLYPLVAPRLYILEKISSLIK